MMALWMVYALAVSALLAAAARAGEKGLELFGKPTRWAWMAALAGAVAVPIVMYGVATGWFADAGASTLDAAAGGAAAGSGSAAADPVPPILLPGAELAALTGPRATGWLERLAFLNPWLLAGWALASAATAGWLLWGWRRLREQRSEWTETTIDGVHVMIAPDDGPAVTGFLRGIILLPAWFDELSRDLQRLILRHEREHLAVGDHRLFAGGLAAVVLVPWNPVLWWILSRLRQAMEIDCDRRVLADGTSRAIYGELLVQVGERASGPPLSPAAFASSSSLLERRIRRLSERAPRGKGTKAAAAGTVAVLLGFAGGWLPAPAGPVEVFDRGAADASPLAATTSERADRVVPPPSAVMRLNLRLYRNPPAGAPGAGEAGPQERELSMDAIRMAKQLGYACTPYLNGSGAAGAGGAGGDAATPGCFVVIDGERTHPSALRQLGSGAIGSIRILPGDEAVERFGPAASNGAYVIRTERG